jgi:hypothetical protein
LTACIEFFVFSHDWFFEITKFCQETPKDAQRLDIETQDHSPPGIYNDSTQRDFEQQIWADFWKVCNDPQLQDELGIRTSQGQTSYVKPIEGKTYRVNIRASGGMSLKPIVEP